MRRGSLVLSSATALLLLLAALPGVRAYAPVTGLEPNPELDGWATFVQHQAGWAPLEYQKASGAQPTLPAEIRGSVATGSILVSPTAIQAPGVLQGNRVGGSAWQSTSNWSTPGGVGGAVMSAPQAGTVAGQTTILATLNTSNAASQPGLCLCFVWWLPGSAYPALNTLYDWITVEYSVAGPACPVAGQCYAVPFLTNLSNSMLLSTGLYVYPNGQERQYYSNPGDGTGPLAVHEGQQAYATFSIGYLSSGAGGFNVTGKDAAVQVYFSLELFLPRAPSATYVLTVYGLSLGTSALTLGPSPWLGTNILRETFMGVANLSSLSPSFAYGAIVGGGYRVAIAQRASDLLGVNVQVLTRAISGGLYAEQATYSFAFGLPADPSLSYTPLTLNDTPHVAGGQYASVYLNGTALTSIYAGLTPGQLATIATGISATNPGVWVGEILYTPSQWASLSPGSGGFFATVGGSLWSFVVEFWPVLALAGLLVLSVAVSHDRHRRSD